MKQSTTLKTSLLFLVLIFSLFTLIPFTQAEDSIEIQTRDVNTDFLISANYKTLSICECATLTETLTISNPGSYPISIHLDTENGYVRFSQKDVTLEAGQTKRVVAYVKAPCDAPSKDTIVIKATSSLGKTKAFTQTVKFSNCQNLQAGVYDRTINASVCQPFSTSFSVRNTGSFRETYEITPHDFTDNIQLSSRKITLNPGQSEDVFVYYKLPCDIYGQHDVRYTVRAVNNDRMVTLLQTLIIAQDYDFSLQLPSDMAVCQEDVSSNAYRFVLTNNNNFTDTFRLDTDFPSFAEEDGLPVLRDLVPETLTLESGESYVQNLSFTSLTDVEQGIYPISITAVSVNGEVSQQVDANISVSDCHNGELFLPDTPKKFYTCAGDAFAKELVIKNIGSKDSDFELLMTAPDFMTLSDDKVSVDAGENESEWIYYDIPDNRSYKYPIDIDLYGRGGDLDATGFKLFVDSKEECFASEIDGISQDLLFTEKNVTLSMENLGTRHGIYEIELLNATDALELNVDEIALGATEEKSFIVTVVKDELLGINETDKDLIGTSFSKTLMVTHEDSGFTQYVSLEIEIVDYSIWQKSWMFIKAQSACTIVFGALALAFLISLIVMIVRIASSNRHFSVKWPVLIWGLALVVVAFVVVSFMYGLPSEGTFYTQYNLSSESFDHILMEEDTVRMIDFDEYFFDPDDNIETYGVRGVNESVMEFSINESHLTLRPVEDWNGVTTLELFVIDEFNETAESGPIVVEVLPVEDHSVVSFFKAGCVHFSVGMLLLIVLAIFFAASMRPKSRNKKRSSRPNSRRVIASKKSSSRKKASSKKKKAAKKTTKKSSSRRKSTTKKKPASKKSTMKKKSSKKKTVSKKYSSETKDSSSKKSPSKKSTVQKPESGSSSSDA
ncbi:MAG: hypothetical protein ACQESE_04310 [Nanobdellota archaeon]